jgi:hypothetical protein
MRMRFGESKMAVVPIMLQYAACLQRRLQPASCGLRHSPLARRLGSLRLLPPVRTLP